MSSLLALSNSVKIRRETILSVLALVEQIEAVQEEVRAAGACRAFSPAETQDTLFALDDAWRKLTDARPVVAGK